MIPATSILRPDDFRFLIERWENRKLELLELEADVERARRNVEQHLHAGFLDACQKEEGKMILEWPFLSILSQNRQHNFQEFRHSVNDLFCQHILIEREIIYEDRKFSYGVFNDWRWTCHKLYKQLNQQWDYRLGDILLDILGTAPSFISKVEIYPTSKNLGDETAGALVFKVYREGGKTVSYTAKTINKHNKILIAP